MTSTVMEKQIIAVGFILTSLGILPQPGLPHHQIDYTCQDQPLAPYDTDLTDLTESRDVNVVCSLQG